MRIINLYTGLADSVNENSRGKKFRLTMKAVQLMILMVGIVLPHSLFAQLSRFSGPVMKNPKIVNLYWDNNWDSDSASVFSTATQPTMANVDAFTQALVATPYFTKARQYDVTGASFGSSFSPRRKGTPPRFGPDLRPWLCGAPKAPSTLSSPQLDQWVTCEIGTPGTGVPQPDAGNRLSTLYVVYLPPGTTIHNGGLFELCSSNVAYHTATLIHQWAYAIVPVQCQGSFAALTDAATHEIIEAATDPIPGNPAWTVPAAPFRSLPGPLGSVIVPTGGEAADAPCATTTGFTFFSINVEAYWSNSDGGCVVGVTPVTSFTGAVTLTPAASSVFEGSTQQFTVSPSGTPVQFTISGALPATDPPSIDNNGLFRAGSSASNNTVQVIAQATDGRAPPNDKATASVTIQVLRVSTVTDAQCCDNATFTITGADFSGVRRVSIVDQSRQRPGPEVRFTVDSPTQITATVIDTILPGRYDVILHTSYGESVIGPGSHFSVRPTITRISPSKGPTTGGTWLDIVGNFYSASYSGDRSSITVSFSAPSIGVVPRDCNPYPLYFSCRVATPRVVQSGPVNIIVTAFGVPSAGAQFRYEDASLWPSLSMSLDVHTLGNGQSTNVTVARNPPAPPGGATITLTSSDPRVVVAPPAQVTIPQGASNAQFTITNHYSGDLENVTISAVAISDGFEPASASAVLGVGTPQTCKPRTCPRGQYQDSDTCLCMKGRPR